MKKLTNVSPFLLLLVPVFVMMLLTLATNTVVPQNEEASIKTNTATKGITKITTIFFK